MQPEYTNINQVVEDFYNYLKNFVTKKVKDQDLASDIVQQVMLKLVETHYNNKDIHNIKAWLFQVTRNAINDYFRKNSLSVPENADFPDSVGSDADGFPCLSLPDYVIPMINFLPENHAKPLFWSDIENVPQQEIALRLGISHSGAKMRIQRARKKLRELFICCCIIQKDANGNVLSCEVKDSCPQLTDHLMSFQKSLTDEKFF
jgi:RNA polymerase sigma-70 factor, ECF subfamily